MRLNEFQMSWLEELKNFAILQVEGRNIEKWMRDECIAHILHMVELIKEG